MAIQNWQEKLKDALLLSDEDAQSVLKGDFKTVLSRNREGALRTLSVYGAFLAAVMIFLLLFSVFGGMFKLILMMLFLGVIAAIGAAIGKEAALQATKRTRHILFCGLFVGHGRYVDVFGYYFRRLGRVSIFVVFGFGRRRRRVYRDEAEISGKKLGGFSGCFGRFGSCMRFYDDPVRFYPHDD